MFQPCRRLPFTGLSIAMTIEASLLGASVASVVGARSLRRWFGKIDGRFALARRATWPIIDVIARG